MSEQDNPNADMSDREQRGQYAYGQTAAAVMTDPARDPAEIAASAGRAGMDVIFGESHATTSETMRQIETVLDGAGKGHYKAVILEVQPEMQAILRPESLRTLSLEEFCIRSKESELADLRNTADNMLAAGTINQAQYDYLGDVIDTATRQWEGQKNSPHFSQQIQNSSDAAIYYMAQKALERGTPVYAADIDRERTLVRALANAEDPAVRMSSGQAGPLMAKSMDDASDVAFLESVGLNFEDPAPVIVHRGYAHINGADKLGETFDGEVEPMHEFDELLAAKGRAGVTIAVLDGRSIQSFWEVNDPADYRVVVGDNGPELDRSAYGFEPPRNLGREQLLDAMREVQSGSAPSKPGGP